MLSPDTARLLHEQRMREQALHHRHTTLTAPRPARARGRRPLRRVIGRRIVRIGLAIAADPRRPADVR